LVASIGFSVTDRFRGAIRKLDGNPVGNPTVQLWAKNGCLDKLDQLLTKRGLRAGARDYELVPALNHLKNDGSKSGYYVPATLIRENDAERTTGVDFDGDGQLKEWAAVDFLGDKLMFGQNGRTDGSLYVGWWGSCDQVALAALLFPDPKRDGTVDGVTFTQLDIRGLLTVIANSLAPVNQREFLGTRFMGDRDILTLKDGSVFEGRAWNVSIEECLGGDFERKNGNKLLARNFSERRNEFEFWCDDMMGVFPAEDVATLEREVRTPSASDFHQTVKRWLRENRPFAMNEGTDTEVWNVAVDEVVTQKNHRKSGVDGPVRPIGFNGPMGDGDYCVYLAHVKGGGKLVKTYQYWIEKKDGEHVNSGWLSEESPGFLWRPGPESGAFTGTNERNPFVEPAQVMELYEKSMEVDQGQVAPLFTDLCVSP
jgi:hypothetical protein